jgi:hypothetical protein
LALKLGVTKIDLLMKKLEDPSLDHLKMVDARMTCEECGETGHMVSIARRSIKMSTLLGIPAMAFVRIKASIRDGISPISPLTTASRAILGRISIGMSPLRDIVREKVKINEDFGKRIHATDKLLENMSSKMDSFIVAMQNQLNFNKILQTQIQKISTVLPRPNNRDSTNTLVQESVTSISALFQGKVPNSTKKSLREVDREKSSVVGVWYPGYCGMPVMAPNSRYDRFPLVENGWGPMNPVPDKAPPLHAEGEGSPS